MADDNEGDNFESSVLDDDDVEEDYGEDETDGNDGLNIMTYKNVIQNINKNPKRTIPFLTKYEKPRIIGVRLQQLANGSKPRVPIKGLKSIEEIAYKELKERKIPFIIRRTLPNGKIEDWKMEEFEIV